MGYLILLYILISWGITDFLVNGSILNSIRTYLLVKSPLLGKLLSCIRCSGFWVGVGMSALLSSGLPLFSGEKMILIIFGGFLTSGSSVLINSLVFFLFSPGIKNKKIHDEED